MQVDLHGDFSGYLSAHPKVPVMTFHHLDAMDPIFPSMDRMQSTRHLMKAADADQSRLLQQTICYHRKTNWSISVSWGYSAQIYERILPRSYLQLPIETFTPWARGSERPFYMFNTRPLSNDSCEKPHFFFLQSVSKTASPHHIVTTYKRASPRGLPPCSSAGNHSADAITKIKVVSPAKKRLQVYNTHTDMRIVQWWTQKKSFVQLLHATFKILQVKMIFKISYSIWFVYLYVCLV